MKTDSFGKFFLTILFVENCRASCQFSARRLSTKACSCVKTVGKRIKEACWSFRYHLFITGEGRELM